MWSLCSWVTKIATRSLGSRSISASKLVIFTRQTSVHKNLLSESPNKRNLPVEPEAKILYLNPKSEVISTTSPIHQPSWHPVYGSNNCKVEPLPYSLLAQIKPLLFNNFFFAMDKPRPVPPLSTTSSLINTVKTVKINGKSFLGNT